MTTPLSRPTRIMASVTSASTTCTSTATRPPTSLRRPICRVMSLLRGTWPRRRQPGGLVGPEVPDALADDPRHGRVVILARTNEERNVEIVLPCCVVGFGREHGSSNALQVRAADDHPVERSVSGARKVGPYMVTSCMNSAIATNLGTALRIKGVSYTISSAWTRSCPTASSSVAPTPRSSPSVTNAERRCMAAVGRRTTHLRP